MPLLNKRLLQELLQKNRHTISDEKISRLHTFLQEKIYNRIQNQTFQKEEAEKPVILPEFFRLLGYTHPENFQFEFSTQARSADVILGPEIAGIRQPEVAIEWKGIDTKDLERSGKAGETAVSQMWDYMGKMNVNLGIVGNFMHWRVYSGHKGQTEFQEFKLAELVENKEKVAEMIFLLSPEYLLKNGKSQSSFEELIQQSQAEQELITKRFYNDYKQKRLNLFHHLVESNQDNDSLFSNEIMGNIDTRNSPFPKGVAAIADGVFFCQPEVSNIDEMIEIQKRAYIKNYVNETYQATEKEVLSQPWEIRKQKTTTRIQDSNCLKVAIKKDSRIIGYGFLTELDKDQLWLKNIIVDPEFQRQGYGQKIVRHLLLNSPKKDILLETTTAPTFYIKFGFEILDPDKNRMILTKENLEKYQKLSTTNYKHLLLEKTQKILDRLIFIMFCEDGFLLPGGTVKQVFKNARNSFGGETKIWEQFKGLFQAIDKGSQYPKINPFNGGLFAEDLELNNLIIKNEIWEDLIKLADYDFASDLNVNILGHIFEQSISDIEEIKEGIENTPALAERPLERGRLDSDASLPREMSEGQRVSKKTSKRKKDGIYYTPEYITDYIVSETVGRWLEDRNKSQEKTNQHKENIEFLKKEIKKNKINNLEKYSIQFFASSQCNDLYLITENDQKYLARITNWEQNKVWKIKQEEYEKLDFIKNLKVAPISHYYDLGNNDKQIHWSLIDFIEGETVVKLSNENLIQLAETLKNLHENTVKDKHGDRWFALENIPYKSYILKECSENKPQFTKKPGYDQLKKSFESINWQEIKQFCLIHNDLKPLNMVENQGRILLIDWEYAYMDIPENDIARFFVENGLTQAQKKLFLENYLPLEKLDFNMDRLEILVNLYEFFEIRKDTVEPNYNLDLNTDANPLQSIKILDPAGGSGAFPNQVHNFLVKKTVELQTRQALADGLENFVPDELTIDKSILKNNIFMVDLQPESVEIAKLSLWLKTARKDQKLDNLDNNVKCGNSLINDPQIAGGLAFDWEKEFGWLRGEGGEENSNQDQN